MENRRTVLGLLGIAGAVPMITGEVGATPIQTNNPDKPSGFRFGGPTPKEVVAALRNLATDIEASGTHVQEFELKSKATLDDFLIHTVTMSFAFDERSAEERAKR